MRRTTLLAFLIATVLAVIVAPAQAGSRGCDLTGDSRRADDCIAHAHVEATADGRMRPGDAISIRERIAGALRGEQLVVEVQMRRVARDGEKGPWIRVHRARWAAVDSAAHAARTVDVCRARLPGRYEFRTSARLPRAMRQAGGVIATSAPTAVTMPSAGTGPQSCANSPDDETSVEYFNQQVFMDTLMIGIADQGSSFAVSLSCPPPVTSTFPPSTLGIAMALQGAATGIACNGSTITLDKAKLKANGYAGCVVPGAFPICTFDYLAYNTATQVVYSDTLLQITMASGSQTIIPQLNAATLPICNQTIDQCLLTGTCTLSPTKFGQLQLCESGSSCAPPATPYSVNSTIYFETFTASG